MVKMPSHKCHVKLGIRLGINPEALQEANKIIDFPQEYFALIHDIKHNDKSWYGLALITQELVARFGMHGRLAVDLHYALDYIDGLLDPQISKKILAFRETLRRTPNNIYGTVSFTGSGWMWSPSGVFGKPAMPISAYCQKCRGKKPPINEPDFCKECELRRVDETLIETPREITLEEVAAKFTAFCAKLEISHTVFNFIIENLKEIVEEILQDREERGLPSLKVIRL